MTTFDERAEALRQAGVPFAIATVVRTVDATSAKPGAKALILQDGSIAEGWVGGGCARGAITRAASEALSDGQPRFVSLRPEELLEAEGASHGEERDGVRYARSRCPSKGSMDVFVEAVTPPPELVVCGESPVALALCELSAHLGFSRTLRAPGLPAEKVPAVERLADDFAFDGMLGAERYVVVATQGKGDEAALRGAIASGAAYVAFVGSHRKFAALRQRLIDDGVGPEALDGVKSPAGLDISAITPDEIALSILAEIVALRRSRQRPAIPA
ncbi:XdhC /CoxI family-like protein [Jiella endophytica]|uniref:XdhC /CoxI family-like protein n=1 Tax=Jiella endophytica TaxID=2558362 RepID=A0A4Y8RWC6_9HYPH|nr:XdhC/CoxI family protein [Jiella endophytica]TFF27764.1 XdhC /CoxI family-like protein [Jiella endophytica]